MVFHIFPSLFPLFSIVFLNTHIVSLVFPIEKGHFVTALGYLHVADLFVMRLEWSCTTSWQATDAAGDPLSGLTRDSDIRWLSLHGHLAIAEREDYGMAVASTFGAAASTRNGFCWVLPGGKVSLPDLFRRSCTSCGVTERSHRPCKFGSSWGLEHVAVVQLSSQGWCAKENRRERLQPCFLNISWTSLMFFPTRSRCFHKTYHLFKQNLGVFIFFDAKKSDCARTVSATTRCWNLGHQRVLGQGQWVALVLHGMAIGCYGYPGLPWYLSELQMTSR